MRRRGIATSRRLTVVAVAAVALSAVACGSSGGDSADGSSSGATPGTTAKAQLFDTDFQAVCQGATQSKATKYDVTAATHKVLYFESYRDTLVQSETKVPTDWQVQFDANRDAFADTDLVACSLRTADTPVKDCTGYKDKDGKDTGNVAKLHTATYELTVHEATTGKSLGTTTIEAADTECPMFVTFQSDTDSIDYYQSPSNDEIAAFLKPYAQPDKAPG